MKKDISIKSINTLRVLACQMIQKANSGHPGIALGASPALYALYANHLNVNPKNPTHILRDRFVLSAGHGSAMLYANLHLFGFDYKMEDLKQFRQVGSVCPGHPEVDKARGVEATTGPLGQGLGMAVGLAMAERHLAGVFNKPDCKLIHNYTYVLAGDGDLMEGVSHEALSLAGTQKLEKLIVLYDSNHITIDGTTEYTFLQNTKKLMKSYGFEVLTVKDANNVNEINKAINHAKHSHKPSFIVLQSIIGFGSALAGTNKVHGSPLGEENLKALQQTLQVNEPDFTISQEVLQHFNKLQNRFKQVQTAWDAKWNYYKTKHPQDFQTLQQFLSEDFKNAEKLLKDVTCDKTSLSTREAVKLVLQTLGSQYDNLFGGAADLVASTKTIVKNTVPFSAKNPSGRNIMFGIREFGMATIANGIALYGGFVPFASTFMVFGDYLKPALRLSALMHQKVLYVLTHDSIGVGEDGPTHQPIEQLAQFRATPNVYVYRPCNLTETKAGYLVALKNQNPTVLALTRQNLSNFESEQVLAQKGGYVISQEQGNLQGIFIATGSEVALALKAQRSLQAKGVGIRVVSMPCVELFEEQKQDYKQSVLPDSCKKRVVIEAGSSFGWHKFATDQGSIMAMTTFGQSGKGEEVFKHFHFTAKDAEKEMLKQLK